MYQFGLKDIAAAILAVASQMAPWLLLGFLLAGVLRLFLPVDKIKKYLGDNSAKAVFWAALLGVPIPLCSCGILPVAASLRKSGAGKGPVAAFLLSTPQTGVDNIIATYGLLGWPFAVWRPVQAFVMGLLGGNLIRLLDAPAAEAGEESCSCEKTEETCSCGKTEETCSCEKTEETCCCEKTEETCCCEKTEETCCCEKPEESCSCGKPSGKRNPLLEVLSYAFSELPAEIGGHLIAGLILSGVFFVLMNRIIASPEDMGLGSQMLLCILLGIPIYVCSTASIPIAMAFLAHGFEPGAVLVFMVTGPETNIASLTVLLKLLGARGLAVYLLTLVVTACLCGWLLNGFLDLSGGAAHVHSPALNHWAWGALLFWVLLAGLLKKYGEKKVALSKKA